MSNTSSTKRVAKNTIFLYIRMFVTMSIGIWTSRLVINALGFTDQGLYNVVGGFIGLLSLVTASIGGSIGRYITFCIGENDYEKANRTVRNAITVQWILSIIVLIIGETIGLWFVNNELVIPEDRLIAVNIVYQFAIGNIVVGLISSAPNALIIAHEKMNVYAYVAIANSLATLFVALAITFFGGDRLVLYAGLQFVVAVMIRIFYTIYVKRTFKYLRLGFSFDKEIFFPIFSFAGWNSIGSSATILRNSGTSILLNIFGGPIANTINGIANSTNNLATIFVNDFTTAYRPQIIKKYAAAEYYDLNRFIHQCSKFTYGLLLVMAVPVYINMEPLLIIWLKKIPEGTIVFARLIIVFSLIESISKPLIIAKEATGKIRNYQIVVGGILLFTLPITFIFLKCDLPLYFAYVSIIITSIIAFMVRLLMLKSDIPYWSSLDFIKTTFLRCLIATVLSFLLPLLLHYICPVSTIWMLIQCLIGFFWSCICFYYSACNKYERKAAQSILNKVFLKLHKKNAGTQAH